MEELAAPTWKGRLIAFGIGLLILVATTELILRIAFPQWRDFYSGWFMRSIIVPGYGLVTTGQPGFDGYFAQNNGDFRVHIKINEFGLRNDERVESADGRIWVVGDSMTFGWGVEEDEIYSSVIARSLNSPVYNIASPGTNICGYQALLARMPDHVIPRTVVMGLILENDISIYDCKKSAALQEAKSETEKSTKSGTDGIKRRLTESSAIYNFIAVSLKRIDVVREILTTLGIIQPTETYKNPLFGSDFDKSVEASVAEIVNFQKMLPKETPFLVVIAPGRFELFNEDELYSKLRKAIGQALAEHGIDFVDPYDAFQEAGYKPTHFAHDGHWTAVGHRLAGEAAAKRLRTLLAP